MSELLETLMIVSFGISWPVSIVKSLKSRTAKGKSPVFMGFVLFGYACGIAAKLLSQNVTYVLVFYVINFVTVSADLGLYFRNRNLDAKAAETAD